MDSSLRSRLSALARRRSVSGATRPGETESATSPEPRSRRRLADWIPGKETVWPSGRCWVFEKELADWPEGDPELRTRLERRLTGSPPEDMAADPALLRWRRAGVNKGVFLDLETTGFAGGPVFLTGLLVPRRETMTFRMFLARDYGEEAAMLEAVSEAMKGSEVVITFNGKSYDIPYLRERIGRLRVGRLGDLAVLDLLHASRRRWKHRFPDCRLQTLERRVCRRLRPPDVPGRDIPDVYHRFVRSGEPSVLARVLSHNLMDLYTLADLLDRVLGTAAVPGSKVRRRRPRSSIDLAS